MNQSGRKKFRLIIKVPSYLRYRYPLFYFGLLKVVRHSVVCRFTVLLLIIVGLGSLALFVRVERHAIDPVMPFALWKNPVILYANLVSLTTGVILIGVSSYLPTFVTGVMEQPAIIAGFTLTAMSIGWPIASSVAGHLLIRYGTFLVSFAGGVSLVFGTTLYLS